MVVNTWKQNHIRNWTGLNEKNMIQVGRHWSPWQRQPEECQAGALGEDWQPFIQMVQPFLFSRAVFLHLANWRYVDFSSKNSPMSIAYPIAEVSSFGRLKACGLQSPCWLGNPQVLKVGLSWCTVCLIGKYWKLKSMHL